MRPYELILPVFVLALLVVALRWQYGNVIERASRADESGALPVSTPILSPICGLNNQNCRDIITVDEPVFGGVFETP